MASDIDIVIQAVDNLSGTVAKIEKNMDKFDRNFKKNSDSIKRSAKATSDSVTKDFKKMNMSFGDFTANVRRIGALVGSFYAVRSAVTALAGVADDFKDFNEGMAYVNTIAQMSEAQLASLTLQVEQLSVTLGKSAPELARGLYDIYSSGFEGAEAMKILEVATTGAIAGLTKTDVAAKGLMAVMNAYNRKTGADAVDIMDVMFKTVDKGVITFEQLASEIGSVVTMSSQLGIRFEEVGAAMSEMTLRGVSASESATALEGLMRSIMKPADQTKKAVKALNEQNKDLNFQWDVATLRAKGLGGMIEMLAEATQGNYEVIGQIIPEIRGMRAAMVLGAEDGEGYNEMLKEQEERLGATRKAFEEANKSVNRQIEQAVSDMDVYQRKIGEVIAEIQLWALDSMLAIARWADENKVALLAVVDTITQLTTAFLLWKGLMLAGLGLKKIRDGFIALQASLVVLQTTMKTTTATMTTMSAAMAVLRNPLVITVAIAGVAYVLQKLNEVKRAYQEIENQEAEMRKNVEALQIDYSERSLSDLKTLNLVKAQLQKEGNTEQLKIAEQLYKDLEELEDYRTTKSGYMKMHGKASGEVIQGYNEEITRLNNSIEKNQKLLEESGKLVGGLRTRPVEGDGNITVPEYGDFPSSLDLLGAEIDSEGKKIQDTIKKINKDISNYYIELGDLANEHVEALEKESEAFEEAALDWARYLEDIDIKLTRLQESHSRTISRLEEDVNKENRNFSEAMDDRAKKFQSTMDKLTQSHQDRIEDLQHDLDLEIGMGVRADKEKIKQLQIDLARENRDYAQAMAEKTEEKELADSREIRSNDEKLDMLNQRLEDEKRSYKEKVDDINKEHQREIVDYAKTQDDIRKKTQDTLQGLVEDYQKAFKSIFDAIRDSGVPSLLAKLPELTKTAIDSSIQGVDIPRNLRAEQEFVKNWGGMHGRLPTAEEISTGVYGTATGPNNPVNISINNPVVTNQAFIDQMANQINTALANNLRQANNGAY